MKIYFGGSIRGGRDDQPIYEKFISFLQQEGVTVLCEHVGYKDLSEHGQDLDSSEIHDRDLSWIDEADGLMAEVTNPSLGVGYEISYAVHVAKIPVLVLFRGGEQGKRLSAMLEGSFGIQVCNYTSDNLEAAHSTIKEFLENTQTT